MHGLVCGKRDGFQKRTLTSSACGSDQLWVQEKVGNGEVELRKVEGAENLADALTKHLDGEGISKHMGGTGQSWVYGRHAIMPHVADGL